MRIGVITPVKHLNGVEDLLNSKGDVFYNEEGNKEEIRSFLIENSIETILCNPNKQNYILDEELLDNTKVKLINTCSTGLSHIDLEYCSNNDITVYSLTKDYELIHDLPSTSELAFGLMLNSLRHISSSQEDVSNFKWDYTKYIGTQIKDLKIGVIGYGRLGKLMVRYCQAFEADVKIYDPYIKEFSGVALEELVSSCDVISLHVHLNEETKKMINKTSLSNSKNNLLLVNTSRGGVVDEDDILELLEEGKIKGYATDVIVDENSEINNSKLIKNMNNYNIIITPHVGGMTIEGQTKAYKWAINKL